MQSKFLLLNEGLSKKEKSLVTGIAKEIEKRKQKTPKKLETKQTEKKPKKEVSSEKAKEKEIKQKEKKSKNEKTPEKENKPSESPERGKSDLKTCTPKIMLASNGKEKKEKSGKKMKRIIRPSDSSDEEGHLKVSLMSSLNLKVNCLFSSYFTNLFFP